MSSDSSWGPPVAIIVPFAVVGSLIVLFLVGSCVRRAYIANEFSNHTHTGAGTGGTSGRLPVHRQDAPTSIYSRPYYSTQQQQQQILMQQQAMLAQPQAVYNPGNPVVTPYYTDPGTTCANNPPQVPAGQPPTYASVWT